MGQANSDEMPEADTFGWDDATRRITKLIMLECVISAWNRESQHYHKKYFKFHRKQVYLNSLKYHSISIKKKKRKEGVF